MWNILDCPVLSVSERGGEVVVGGGAAGLERDETRSVALASLPRQLISASCWRLAERKYTPGGLALESFCSSSTDLSDLRTEFTYGCSHLLFLCRMKICECSITHF